VDQGIRIVVNGVTVFELPFKRRFEAKLLTKEFLAGGRDLNLGDRILLLEINAKGESAEVEPQVLTMGGYEEVETQVLTVGGDEDEEVE